MIYVCCDERVRREAEDKVIEKFRLKELTDSLEDASEIIVVGIPDEQMEDRIRYAKGQEKKIRYENKQYLQKKIVNELLATREEIEEQEQKIDIEEYLEMEWE